MIPNSHEMESSKNFELHYKEEPMIKPSILGERVNLIVHFNYNRWWIRWKFPCLEINAES